MDALEELARAGAIYKDRHFVYVSKKHGPHYINMDKVFPDLYVMSRLCRALGRPFREDDIEIVVGPATGGIPLAYLTALGLANGNAALAPGVLWADKQGEAFKFERAGFEQQLRRARVLVVEDMLTTGGSVEKVCREIESLEATVVGVSVICNRGGVTAEQLGVRRLESLANVKFEALDLDENGQCSLCREGLPIVVDVGHGGEYKLAHPDYAGGYIKLL